MVPYLPHSDLRDVNFDNDHILEFFGKLQVWLKINSIKLGDPPGVGGRYGKIIMIKFKNFFLKFQLDQTQLCLLAEMYSSKWGEDLYDNKERLEKIGNAFCGFSVQDLRKITTPVLK